MRRLLDFLFPPVVCGTNARMRALLAANPLPPPRIRAAEPPTAIERENLEVDRAVAAAEAQMHEEWLGRR